MDDNTFRVLLALVAMIQVVALAYLGVRQQSVSKRVDSTQSTVANTAQRLTEVHYLVDGLAHEKESALAQAERAKGELAGRDFEAAKLTGIVLPIPPGAPTPPEEPAP